jgi:uncharacterized protein YndB with AHSA1/START domain
MTSNPRPAPRILGSLRSAGGKGVVRIEDRYGTGIDDLWSALTDPGRLASWYGQVEGDLRLGGQFRLHVEDADADATGRVEACEPPRRLQVRTRETEESHRRGKGVPPYDEALDAASRTSCALTPTRVSPGQGRARHTHHLGPDGRLLRGRRGALVSDPAPFGGVM